jgi:hypothetical protein
MLQYFLNLFFAVCVCVPGLGILATMEGKLILLFSMLMVATLSPVVEAQGKTAPATFVFGDSLVDVGNNNYFFTLASADHKPYGIDRADKVATGRFCNGKIIPDLVSTSPAPSVPAEKIIQ